MRRQIIVGFFSLFLIALIPAKAETTPRGALFSAQKDGHSLFVFGTMHVGKPEFFPLDARIENAIAGASVLALEIDQAADPAGNGMAMQQAMMLPPGAPNPYAALDAATRARLEKALGGVGMPLAAVQGMRPWALAVVMAVQQFTVAGYRPDLASDGYLANFARSKKVKVVELESVASQLAHFTRLSDADQMRFLTDALDQGENGRAMQDLQDLVNAWGKADQKAISALAAKAAEDTSFSGKFTQEVLLEGRNGPMADKIATMAAKEKQMVVAIGLLHLVGKRSVIEHLESKGWKFTRVY